MRGSLAASAVFQQLVAGLRFQGDAHALNARRIAGVVEQYPRDANARIVAASHETRKKVKLPIPRANGSRVEDALHLVRVAHPRFHDRADPF